MARSCHVAVIGAGLAGLVAARELSREGNRVVVFEKGERVGGTWVYDPRVESALLGLDSDRKIVHSSLYRSLRTNFPRWGMCFLDFDFTTRQYGDPRNFPWHEEVLAFLDDFTREFDLTRLIRLDSEVVQVRGGVRRDEWVVEWRSRRSEPETTNSEVFDAVVVCNGHHTEPQIANDVAGLDKWPGKQMHSHNYRIPELFQDQIVVLIGNGPSSSDISIEISKFAKEVHRASRTKNINVGKLDGHDNIWQHPMIESAHEDGRVVFKDGTSILPDVIIHCTGYKYRFPFLEKSGVVGVDDNRVEHLYKHVFPPHFAPCLSFVGIPDKGNTFLVSELQSKWIAQVLSGKVLLPTEEEMLKSVKELYHNMEESGTPKRFTHVLFPHEYEYINWVAAQVGLPPMEEWREQILYEVFKVIQANRHNYRDDCYWSQYSHSSIRSSEQHPLREQLLLEILKGG